MPTVESILEQAAQLNEADRERLVRLLRRRRFDEVLSKIEHNDSGALPIGDDELDRLVHEARREVLRARGI